MKERRNEDSKHQDLVRLIVPPVNMPEELCTQGFGDASVQELRDYCNTLWKNVSRNIEQVRSGSFAGLIEEGLRRDLTEAQLAFQALQAREQLEREAGTITIQIRECVAGLNEMFFSFAPEIAHVAQLCDTRRGFELSNKLFHGLGGLIDIEFLTGDSRVVVDNTVPRVQEVSRGPESLLKRAEDLSDLLQNWAACFGDLKTSSSQQQSPEFARMDAVLSRIIHCAETLAHAAAEDRMGGALCALDTLADCVIELYRNPLRLPM